MIDRIALVTDFGPSGAYMGQMRLRLSGRRRDIPVVDLISDLAPFRPDLAGYLLPGLVREVPAHTLYLCVVDPGVGGARAVLVVEADGNWYIGPDNGMLALITRRAKQARVLRVDWRPKRLSASFHGRDLFCPLAAKLVRGKNLPDSVPLDRRAMLGVDWPDQLQKVIYADRYGNLITGIVASHLDKNTYVNARGREIPNARTFCDVPLGKAFWYEDSFGLVELAVNQGSAQLVLGLSPGDEIGLSQGFREKGQAPR